MNPQTADTTVQTTTTEVTTEVKVPCEVYSRIVGYLRPVSAWNEGKKQEFEERQVFTPQPDIKS